MNYLEFRGVYILMKKAGLKTFVYSFVFSLSAIFTADSLFSCFHSPREDSSELKISNQNITLFFKDEFNAVPAQIKPIKKIALSLPLSQEDISAAETSKGFSPPLFENVSAGSEIVFSGEDSMNNRDDIPLEIAYADIAETEETVKTASTGSAPVRQGELSGKNIFSEKAPVQKVLRRQNGKADLPEKVSENFDSIIKSSPPVHEDELIVSKEPEPKLKLASEAASRTPEVSHEPRELVVAQKAPLPTTKASAILTPAETNESSLLIPLEKDNSRAENLGKIEIVKAADTNQIAMTRGDMPIKSLVDEKFSPEEDIKGKPENENPKEWQPMAEKAKEKDSPWIAARGAKHPKNNAVLEQKYYTEADREAVDRALHKNSAPQTGEGEVKLAAEMVKNILIPIPEDILNDENLTPQLVSSKKDRSLEEEITEQERAAENIKKEIEKEKPADNHEENAKKTTSLLKSLTSIFSGSSSKEESKAEEKEKNDDEESGFFDKITKKFNKQDNRPNKILPAEMRLSFQPNRAEISGQTLKWIQAFANKVNEDDSVILEIRIDGTSSFALQQKRLNLLQNILSNKGVAYNKISTVFTTREPNSFIIRTVRINNTEREVTKNSKEAPYYQPW